MEFKAKQDELIKINAQVAKLAKEIQDLQSDINAPGANENAIAQINAKTDDNSRLEIDFKRKQEDAKVAFEKREKAITRPIVQELSKAIDV